MDLYEHVNNVSYFRYIQAARIHFWEQKNLYNLHKENGLGFIVSSTSYDFKKPMQYPGCVDIETQVGEIYNSSFELRHLLFDEEKQVTAEAKDILVIYSYQTKSKITIDQDLYSLQVA